MWPYRFATSLVGVFGDRDTGSQDAPDAIAALVDAFRPLDHESADLLCAVSHQLRTPLTSIVGFTELLAEGAAGPVTPEQRRMLATVARNAACLMGMLEALEPSLQDRLGPSFGPPGPISGYGAVRIPDPGRTPRDGAQREKTW